MFQAKEVKYEQKIKGKDREFQLKKVSFSMEDGYFLALLGENGAGKSTLLRVLNGMVEAETGQICMDAWSVKEHLKEFREAVAYVGEEPIFFSGMTLQENIEILQHCYADFSMESFREYLTLFEIPMGNMGKCISECSSGEKKRIELAFALAKKPKLLLLDEPTANLDPVFRTDFMELLQKKIAEDYMSIIFSTNILADVEDVADYILLLQEGEMTDFGEKEAILDKYGMEELRQLIGGREDGTKCSEKMER